MVLITSPYCPERRRSVLTELCDRDHPSGTSHELLSVRVRPAMGGIRTEEAKPTLRARSADSSPDSPVPGAPFHRTFRCHPPLQKSSIAAVSWHVFPPHEPALVCAPKVACSFLLLWKHNLSCGHPVSSLCTELCFTVLEASTNPAGGYFSAEQSAGLCSPRGPDSAGT